MEVAGDQHAPQPLVIAVDLSTTACKAIAFGPRGEVVATARVPLVTSSPHPGWLEQSSEAWWSSMCAALRQVIADLDAVDIDATDIRAVSITHQRETFVCLDRDGREIRPAILWLDARATEQVLALGSPHVHDVTGRPPSTAPSFYKLAWLREHEPEVMERTAKVAEVHAFLVHRLTGDWVTSWASADPTGLLDVRTFDYSKPLLELVGLDEAQLPALVAPGQVAGHVSGWLPARRACHSVCPSSPLVATASVRGWVPPVATAGGLSQPRHGHHAGCSRRSVPERLGLPHARQSHRRSLDAGGGARERRALAGVVQGARPGRSVRDAALDDLEARAAAVSAGADGLLFLPYLVRAETPYWDPSATRGVGRVA